MIETETSSSPPEFAAYGAEIVRDALNKMLALADAVREGADVEAVHNMRVASRRLRAAISVFEPAYSSREYDQFAKDVKAVTQELGAARDLDVMIETLVHLEHDLPPEQLGGIDRFVQSKREQRQAMQRNVIKSLDRMEKRNLAAQFDKIAAAAMKPVNPIGEASDVDSALVAAAAGES